LGDQEKWPSQGSLNYNTILQLDLFYKRKKSKLRFPYKFLPSEPPQYSKPPKRYFPLQQIIVERGKIYGPFQLSDLRKIKKHLNSCTDAQTNTFKPLSL
jgi:hypothetical protein